MTVESRYTLLRSVGEECIQENELRSLIEKKPGIRCYDGFEPSGRMHIAQGIFKAVNVNKCTESGCEFVFWVADWFALMNDKVGGEMERIRVVGRYLLEVWKAAGMNMEKVLFLWSSDEITSQAEKYWKIVLDIGRRNTIARIKKCCTIMGKQEGTLTAAQMLYPLMQCADIFFLKTDICQLGLDQRKVNMLAREYCDLIGRKLKPVILSHHMLSGLKQGQGKMSKSDPDSAIFMEDTAEDVARKVYGAYCPRIVQQKAEVTEDGTSVANEEKNPVLDYIQCIVYSKPDGTISIDGTIYATYEELEAAFVEGVISEIALKDALISAINIRLEPVRQHFSQNKEAAELLEKVISYRKDKVPLPLEEIPLPEQSDTPLAVAWLPTLTRLPVDISFSICSSIRLFLQENPQGEAVLVLPEWTAFACGEVTGEEKDIKAALNLGVALLQAHWLPKERVRVVGQEQLILQDPNAYWLTAINAGRKNKMQRLEEVCGEMKSAGHIVSALMYVADAVLLKATHLISTSHTRGYHDIVVDFFQGNITTIVAIEDVIPPLHRPDAGVAVTDESGSGTTISDNILFLDDADMEVRRKIKKAYCAPNENQNPILSIASWILQERCTLLVERAESNGGNVTYSNESQLRNDAQAGALHPADLKTAVTKVLLEGCRVSNVVLSTPEGKKLAQRLRQAEKSLRKK